MAEKRLTVLSASLEKSFEALFLDLLVFRYEGLHDRPCDQICYGAYAEDDHIAGFLAFE